jgi:hypothetical protein
MFFGISTSIRNMAAIAWLHCRIYPGYALLMPKLGWNTGNSPAMSPSTKWLIYSLAGAIGFVVLAFATVGIGGYEAAYIPGPGFVIFGFLAIISLVIFALLLLYRFIHLFWPSA